MFQKPLLSCLFLAAAAAPALSQGPAANGAAQFVLEPGAIEIAELIDRAASHLGWNILVDPQELQHCSNQLKLQNRVEVGHSGCEDLVTTMLATRGVVVRTLDKEKNLYEVISLHGPRAREAFSSPPQKTVEQILERPNLRMPVMTVMQLQNVNAMHATNALRPFFASSQSNHSQITIGNAGNGKAMLISGLQDQVANAIRVVQQADVQHDDEHAQTVEARVATLQERVSRLEKALARLEKEK